MHFSPLKIRNLSIDPPLFCAPMAGITHSAFRRLVSDFGGYGALFTEMLSVKALVSENIGETTFTKRRDKEGIVLYQLVLNGEEDIAAAIGRLKAVMPDALDINAGCPAPEIVKQGMGAALFRDTDRFRKVISCVRRNWDGPLTVKCRLGDHSPLWEDSLREHFHIMESEGVDAVFLHPRYYSEKLKRKARWEFFDMIASWSSIPIIGNGDIVSAAQVEENTAALSPVSGLMIGRMSVVRPWIFRELSGIFSDIDYASAWSSIYRYINEDFTPHKALLRIKEYSKYFAQNFLYGHEMYRKIRTVHSLDDVYENAMNFLESFPAVTKYPTVMGL
jgi:tRNA-dihydrouridine synthase B